MKRLLRAALMLVSLAMAPAAYPFVNDSYGRPMRPLGGIDANEWKAGSEQLLTVNWELNSTPMAVCHQSRHGAHSLAAARNGLCATLRFDHPSQGAVCTIVTQHQTTHQDIGVLFQWCMERELAIRNGRPVPELASVSAPR